MGRRETNGFTLIELMVVIAVIALLLSIMMPSLEKAKQCVSTCHQTRNSQWQEGTGNVVLLDGHVETVDPHAPEGELYSNVTFNLSWPK